MKYGFVNEKFIDGKKYQIWRDMDKPKDEILKCQGKQEKVKIKDIWSNNEKIKKVKVK